MMAMLCLLLASCATPLQTGEQRRPLGSAAGGARGLPTSTPGIEPTRGAGLFPQATGVSSVETAIVAEATAVAEVPAEAAQATPLPAGPTVAPTVNPQLANVQLPAAADLQARWRAMQVEREAFSPPRPYTSPGYQVVWWFDPVFGSTVPIGQIRGEFPVQATFRIRGMWIGALEIPYHVNQQFGFAVPEPILQRMRNAGVGEWAEVFVYQTQDIQPK